MTEREQLLTRLLGEVEWAATIWTDYPACPFCRRLQEGATFVNPPEEYPPKTHAPDCAWKQAMEGHRFSVRGFLTGSMPGMCITCAKRRGSPRCNR